LEIKNSELAQKLNEQYQQIDRAEKTIQDLQDFCNNLQNRYVFFCSVN